MTWRSRLRLDGHAGEQGGRSLTPEGLLWTLEKRIYLYKIIYMKKFKGKIWKSLSFMSVYEPANCLISGFRKAEMSAS
jgi:hypothetical protein